MLLRLGLETGLHHAAADEDRLSGMDVANVDGYRAFLTRVFGFGPGDTIRVETELGHGTRLYFTLPIAS